MILKSYQERVLADTERFFELLGQHKRQHADDLRKASAGARQKLAQHDVCRDAWEALRPSQEPYISCTNGSGHYFADVFIKVPTGGGKTLLACHAIDQAQSILFQRKTGLILWIVPSTQIYNQTLTALRDKMHPYRQILDICSNYKTAVLQKSDRISAEMLESQLVILMLMLPATNRKDKEFLKIYQDSAGYESLFPPEHALDQHSDLLQNVSNLDCFVSDRKQRQIKTSLANAVRLNNAMFVVDEGQKAYSALARDTLNELNPALMLELSATPPSAANILVGISGNDLEREGMIKLDICLTNYRSATWQDTIRASVDRRRQLEQAAIKYANSGGEYIRPIVLIQVERTGKDQKGKYIHADDVRDFLSRHCDVDNQHIAIKSSVRDELEGIDLLSQQCGIRYIITKAALQEGWDCSFAYVLAVLTNPNSKTALTQLIGRILRQPYAVKTKVRELDECYVFAFRRNTDPLVAQIRADLGREGLSELVGRIIPTGEQGEAEQTPSIGLRDGLKKHASKLVLPMYVIRDDADWRVLSYESDIISRIDWRKLDLKGLNKIKIAETSIVQSKRIGLASMVDVAELDEVPVARFNVGLAARRFTSIVRNPWIAYDISLSIKEHFYSQARSLVPSIDITGPSISNSSAIDAILAANEEFIVGEVAKLLQKEQDRLAEIAFLKLLEADELCFALGSRHTRYNIPTEVAAGQGKVLNREDGRQLEKSLYEYEFDEQFNNFEKDVARYLDVNAKLLWWMRNEAQGMHYFVQGWKRHKVYPDFIAATVHQDGHSEWRFLVLETKGVHLKNEDTEYKKKLFACCEEAMKANRGRITGRKHDPAANVNLHVIFQDEWQSRLNEIMMQCIKGEEE